MPTTKEFIYCSVGFRHILLQTIDKHTKYQFILLKFFERIRVVQLRGSCRRKRHTHTEREKSSPNGWNDCYFAVINVST